MIACCGAGAALRFGSAGGFGAVVVGSGFVCAGEGAVEAGGCCAASGDASSAHKAGAQRPGAKRRKRVTWVLRSAAATRC